MVPLIEIHSLLISLPEAATAYSRDAFAVDLLRLDRAPDTRIAAGHRFALPASTGSKGRNRLVIYDKSGAQHVYVGIRFTRDATVRDGEHVART